MHSRLSSPSLDPPPPPLAPSAAIAGPLSFPPTLFFRVRLLLCSLFTAFPICRNRQKKRPQLGRPGLEYETGQLAFLMDATVSATVMWHGHTTYPFSFSIHDYYIKVSDTTDYDRSLCNCTQMMQGGAPQPWQDRQQGRRRRSRASQQLQAEKRGGGAGGLAADDVLLPPATGERMENQ